MQTKLQKLSQLQHRQLACCSTTCQLACAHSNCKPYGNRCGQPHNETCGYVSSCHLHTAQQMPLQPRARCPVTAKRRNPMQECRVLLVQVSAPL